MRKEAWTCAAPLRFSGDFMEFVDFYGNFCDLFSKLANLLYLHPFFGFFYILLAFDVVMSAMFMLMRSRYEI